MSDFTGLRAQVTGGASGTGRTLARLAGPLSGAATGTALAVGGRMRGLRLRPAAYR
ncbi:hypothetical protein [Streptomyces sp. NRRL S-1022]|uniref:hypothetical protein n=1 Tax=Streptomyces sp. NRRL S-1022 TaxID=1463880 RepID=UPI000A7619C4